MFWFLRAVEALKGTMVEWQRSGFNTSKVHMMNHFTSCIKRSGLPWEYSTDLYEQFHIALMKTAYRSSNKRQATPQIVRHNKRLQSLRRATKQIEGLESRKKAVNTPLKKVRTCTITNIDTTDVYDLVLISFA